MTGGKPFPPSSPKQSHRIESNDGVEKSIQRPFDATNSRVNSVSHFLIKTAIEGTSHETWNEYSQNNFLGFSLEIMTHLLYFTAPDDSSPLASTVAKKVPCKETYGWGGGGGDASKPFPPSSIHSILSIHVMTLLNIPVMAVFSINIYSFSRGVKRSFFVFSAFVIEKQPPQVLKTQTKFTSTVRFVLAAYHYLL